jgi:hypothetical protein
LTQLPLAARSPSFTQDLRNLGVKVGERPGLMDIVAAISAAIDKHSREEGGRTDLGELAQMAAVESIARRQRQVLGHPDGAADQARVSLAPRHAAMQLNSGRPATDCR